jgi:hypothetical protein
LQKLSATDLLPSVTGRGTLRNDLRRFISVIDSDDFDIERIQPLLSAVLDHKSDLSILNDAYNAINESTPSPRLQAHALQTPCTHSTSSIVNSSEHRQHMDDILKEELGPIYIGLLEFHEVVFEKIQSLKKTAEAIFHQCQEVENPLYHPKEGCRATGLGGGQEKVVLKWFTERVENFLDFAKDQTSLPDPPRRPLTRPNQPLEGSTAERKLDIGFLDDPKAGEDSRYHWSRILVPRELKSNPSLDMSEFRVDERLQWTAKGETRQQEDNVYCLLGILIVFMSHIW